ncbi:cytochrome c [Acidocella sp.]|uniref:c-type cytochrome n=1 Tax=Acidocella sp. TaxID=50710 RepID=UPI0026243DEB|nr:cytochrome c [Acidocella sp.]
MRYFDAPGRAIAGILAYVLLSAPAAAFSGNPVIGKELYGSNCSGCHLESGAGGVHFSHSVSADLRAPGLEMTYRHNVALLVRAILDAKDETGERLDSPMPAWKGRLSQAQALDIVAYLKTLNG